MNFKRITGKADFSFEPDKERYISNLRDMIACRTISAEQYYDKSEFEKFDAVLNRNYPCVMSIAEKIEVDGSTFLRLKGKSEESPLVLMSHKDIVHEGKKKWKAEPYAGKVINGKMFGRGTFDCKGSLCAIFEAMESLLKEGIELQKDVYIFASSTEETAGPDAPDAVEYFRSRDIVPGLVLDEGGAILKNPFPSRIKRFAMFGAVERSSGYMLFDNESESESKAFIKAAKKLRPGEFKMYPEVSELVHGLSDYLGGPIGSVLKFLDKKPSLTKTVLTHVGPDARSFCGSLVYARKLDDYETKKAADKHEGIRNPVRINVSGNFYNKIEKLTDEVKLFSEKFGMKLVEENIRETETPVRSDSDGFRFTGDVAKLVYDDIAVLPYPVLGRTDSRYFIGYADNVIRCAPLEINLFQMMKFHNPNENIYVSSLPDAVAFYREAVKQYMNI